jgi:hypothetical protein
MPKLYMNARWKRATTKTQVFFSFLFVITQLGQDEKKNNNNFYIKKTRHIEEFKKSACRGQGYEMGISI